MTHWLWEKNINKIFKYDANIEPPSKNELIELRNALKEKNNKKEFREIHENYLKIRRKRFEFIKGKSGNTIQ